MTHNESSTAADAITAATVQGLHAFMASEAKAAATDTQLEAEAGVSTGGPTGMGHSTCICERRNMLR